MAHDQERRAAVLDESHLKRLLVIARSGKHGIRNEAMIHLSFVSTLMGHASVAMTARYVENNPVRLKRICEEVSIGLPA